MSDATEQRKLAAIMFTDMVGYSALSQRDDKLALELLEEHRQLLREIFPRFHGTEIKTIGDAFLVEFNSALEAAQCAIEIQRTLAKRNHDVTADRHIELKIGVHIGDVVHRGGDVYGDGVNIASRIEPLAGAGGICVSMDVERQIRNAVETRFEKLAQTELKNISVPMELFRIVLPWERHTKVEGGRKKEEMGVSRRSSVWVAVAAALLLLTGVGWWWTTLPPKSSPMHVANNAAAPRQDAGSAQGNAAAIPEKSIAVLPFDNLSRDPDNAFFAEGVQDEILTRLAKVADLKVISRTSTQRFKSVPTDLRDIAKQLGVMNVVEGSVQKANDQVRVNVQLINAINDAHLWAEVYDRKLTDIFAVESDIAKAIADKLQAKLTGIEMSGLTHQATGDPAVHELYIKGRHFWGLRRGDNIPRAIEFFNQAIARDPDYAPAYAGLSEAYILLHRYTPADPKEDYPKARAAAIKALELDPNLAEAHNALGKIAYDEDLDFAESTREFRRAIELNPNYAGAHHWFSGAAPEALGHFDEAIAESKRGTELDPLSAVNLVDQGRIYLSARRFSESKAVFEKALALDPDFAYAHWHYGEMLQANGDLNGAAKEYAKARTESAGPEPVALLGQLGAKMGRPEEAKQALADLDELSKHRPVRVYWRALVYLSLGDKEHALSALEQSYAEHDGYDICIIKVDPMLDSLRGDPRFEALVQKIVSPKTEVKQ